MHYYLMMQRMRAQAEIYLSICNKYIILVLVYEYIGGLSLLGGITRVRHSSASHSIGVSEMPSANIVSAICKEMSAKDTTRQRKSVGLGDRCIILNDAENESPSRNLSIYLSNRIL